MLENLPCIINNYTFIKLIGAGTYSTVYQVESIKYQQTFAAKVSVTDSSVISENGDIVDAEFNALQKLDHPHIIRVFDKFFVPGFFIIILEYFPGGTVQDLINAGRRFSAKSIQNFGYGILDGLALCHGKNLAHRDIKPSNIFIDGYGRGKLADFNLCSILKSQQNLVESACGSLPYVSPEILQGAAYDPFKADIWALGVTFYQMVTNQLPWTDKEIRVGRRKPLQFPADFDHNLKQIISAMLSLDPMQRPTAALLKGIPFFQEGAAPFRSPAHISSSSILSRSSIGFSEVQSSSSPGQGDKTRTPSSIRMSAKILIRTGNNSARPRRNSSLNPKPLGGIH